MRGANIIGLARSKEKATEALAKFQGKGKYVPVACELCDPTSVRSAVEEVKKTGLVLDAIIANAGIMAVPTLELVHGYEKQFFTNHIGHFMLVTELLDSLAEDGRVVSLSSFAHFNAPWVGIDFDNLKGEKSYSPYVAYGRSKMANLLFVKSLAKRFEGTKRTANAVHPGVIYTNLYQNSFSITAWWMRNVASYFIKNVQQGAASEVYVATNPDIVGVNGKYFEDCNVSPIRRRTGTSMETAEQLWKRSEEIVEEVTKA
eukprot:CFRG3225T1